MDTHNTADTTTSQEHSPAAALHRLQQQVEALQAYMTHCVSAHVDRGLLAAQHLALGTVLGVLGLMALAGLVVTAIVLLLAGAATGLALLCNGGLWLGQVIVGGGILVLLALTLRLGLRTWHVRSSQQTVHRYDERQCQQRAAFGKSVTDYVAQQHDHTNDAGKFLTQQAADATTAVRYTVTAMQATAHEVVNVRWWTQRYPWYAVGTAAVLGLLAATCWRAASPPQTQAAPPVQSQVATSTSWMESLCAVVCRVLVSVILDALRTQGQKSERAE